MGKNKKDIFKVAGAKSLKAKTKAKPVGLKLKKLSLKIKEQVAELDLRLTGVNDLLRKSDAQQPAQENPPSNNSKPKISEPVETTEVTDYLNDLQCN